ncbi:MAG TPA: DeoR/GlpR family DNA-binding transcription regulator [Caldilineaceae bacterium]|nr:DeoR/GlpR family DNA-binding transcription regulator [Caldilineaceae bacterium]
MLAERRRQLISQRIQEQGSVATDELAADFSVSHMTIWRDLTALENIGSVRRVRGGAVRVEQETAPEPFFSAKRALHSAEKEAIARYAARTFVHDNDIIILEAGTTVSAMVKHLDQRNLTLITNGLATLSEAAPSVPDLTVIGCGGILRDVSYTFVGPQAEQFFRTLRAGVLFLGATGLAFPEGITDPNPLEIQVKQAMAASAERVVLLLDSSKFGVRSLLPILPLERISVVVTDAAAPAADVERLRAQGIEVHFAT